MTEKERLISLFEKLYDGAPWLDVNLRDTLNDIDADKAAAKILQGRNSIWEITNHVIAWRQNVLERVKGKVLKTPDTNYIQPITDTSTAAWKATLQQLHDTQDQWLSFLQTMDTGEFDRTYPVNNLTYFEHIHGIIQHDAYHLGQIVLLSKI